MFVRDWDCLSGDDGVVSEPDDSGVEADDDSADGLDEDDVLVVFVEVVEEDRD